MNYRIRITDTAKQDLREIAIWILEQSSDIDTAKRFVNELRTECNTLGSCPRAGALPKDHILRSIGFRFITFKDYLIFYQLDDDQKIVDITAIFNSKKDYVRVMKRYI